MSSDFAMPECERPLPPIRNGLYLLIGILLVALFYVYSALFLLVGALLWPLLFILMLLDPNFEGGTSSRHCFLVWGPQCRLLQVLCS